ncbi:WD repeat-containing protein 6, partial [Coelomomyces lativittatus]
MDTYCVIYSAAMHGTTLASLIIASGAPTQKIVLRKLNIKTSMTEIMGEFIGHEGAIFGLAFHSSGKWLVSTSEDRSVRVWCTQTYECTYCYYGHLARVWQAMFLQDYVVSISEDAQCRFWKLGKCRFIGEGHRGQHIWKLQVNPNETQVVTGGNDGVVRVWNLKDIEQSICAVNTPIPFPFPKATSVKNFTFIDTGLICVTSEGHVSHYDLPTSTWNNLTHLPELGHFTLMCGQGPYVLLGPSQGPLHCYQSITSPTSTPPTTTTMTTSSMILSPTLSSSFTLSVPTTYQQVKSIGEDYWMVQDAHSLWVYQKNILKRTWTWTEWVLDAIVWEHGLVVATRSSQVVCFYWHTDTVDRVDAHHHQQAVTSLAWIPRGTSLCLVSGGRDGFLNVWETHSEHSSLSLTWMYGERISKGWVEK